MPGCLFAWVPACLFTYLLISLAEPDVTATLLERSPLYNSQNFRTNCVLIHFLKIMAERENAWQGILCFSFLCFFCLFVFFSFIGVENFIEPSPRSCGEFNHNSEELLHGRLNESSVYCLKRRTRRAVSLLVERPRGE